MGPNKVKGNDGYRKLPAVKITPKWSGPGDRGWPSSEIPSRTIDAGAGIVKCNQAYRGDGIIMEHHTSNEAPAAGRTTPNRRYSSKPTRRAGGVNS